jgi:methionyl-tRNA formyltransferase
MNVLLAAEESAGLQMLHALARSNHRLVAVLTSPPKPKNANASVWNVAKELGFDTWPAKLVKDPSLGDRLRSQNVDILLNIHSLYIVHKRVIAAPRLGAFNLHPGPLPRYAGLNAVSWALYRGEKIHGVTVHKMEPEIDTGPIVYQSLFPICENDTALSLVFRCAQEGIRLMLKLLEVASAHPVVIPLSAQDLTKREYFGTEVPNHGCLSWSAPAHEVVEFVRACDYFPFRSPWGHPQTRRGDQVIEVVKASRTGITTDSEPGSVGEILDSGVPVACSDEWVVAKKLRVGRTYLHPTEILKPGDRLTGFR